MSLWSPVPESRVPRGVGIAAVAFVAIVLFALAAVPIIVGRQVAEAQHEISDILGPARLLAARLSLAQARQMSYFQAFLLTGDPEDRVQYRVALTEEDKIFADLRAIARQVRTDSAATSKSLLELLADLSTRSTNWHLAHQDAFFSEGARRLALANLPADQRRFDDLQGVALEVERTLQRQMDAGSSLTDRLQTMQTRFTIELVVLALVGTLGLVAVGHRMRALTREAEEGRLDAIRTRGDAHALLEATDDGVLGLANDGRCISVNRAAAMLLGYAGRELRGQDVHAALHHTTPGGSRRPREESPILAALAVGTEARSTDYDVFWRSDRSPLPVQWSLRPLSDERGVRGGVLTFSDMTEIRAKESALRRAVRVREEVVSVVSHDLRNPLGVVAGAADILLDLPLEEAERRKQLEIIRRSAGRMGRLVENLLDIARIEAGALVVRTAPEDPESLLEETRSVFAGQAEARDLTLSLELDGVVPPVLADRDRVQQALANLVGNALKFTPRGGRITLSARAEGSDRVALSVTDTGPGVSLEEMRLVFDRFWQASRHDRTGSGLGLAIVRGIAEVHGGSVHVSEAPGGGARFTLTLLMAAAGPGRAERA